MANGGQIIRFKLDSNEILLYNQPPCELNWNLMNFTSDTTQKLVTLGNRLTQG